MAENNIVISDRIQIAPIRTINEFILDKARFELPTFTDLSKWNNRVVTNLLYYQTNYFALALVFILLSSFVHAQDVFVGISAFGLVIAALAACFSKNMKLVQARSEHPYIVVALVGVIGYYFIYVLPSVIILLFSFAVPLLLVFVHASVRLRNFSAKVNRKAESLNLKKTLMGQFLDLLNVNIGE